MRWTKLYFDARLIDSLLRYSNKNFRIDEKLKIEIFEIFFYQLNEQCINIR